MTKLTLYNTLGREKQEFKPLKGKKVGLYTCGPTVYNYAHIGNLRTYVFEDMLKRTLLGSGFEVRHVMNITDVGHLTDDADQGEDKMERAARESKKSAWDLAKMYTQAFKKDMQALNILEPDIWCAATDHIQEQIDTIKKIETNGFTYQTSDGIYFDTSKLPNYGELGKLDIEGLEAGKRVAMNEKKNPTDFALWKFSKKGEQRQMEWDSPWGIGFPGWHIECSAMAVKYLGVPFDIHCGGIDHVTVHHPNEIAQTEAAEGKPLAKWWIHGEFLQINEGRMGKSEGNGFTMHTIREKGFSPMAYRYLLLGTHYRQKLNFTWDSLQAAQNALNKLYVQAIALGKPGKVSEEFSQRFYESLRDDLNAPQGLAIMWELLKSDESNPVKAATLFEFDTILGLQIKTAISAIREKLKQIPAKVEKLLDERAIARTDKNWEQADLLRAKIEQAGFWMEDTEDGTKLIPKM